MSLRLSVFLLLVLPLKFANAAIYYVDASFGNDRWGGQQAEPIGSPTSDGPWQSLAKVSTSVLAPGDSVLLKCGGTWHETLTLQSSGTIDNPITIGTYPSACTNKPIISGAIPIPGYNWIRDTGNVYKTSTAIDFIYGGTFENGLGYWTKSSPENDAIMSLTTECANTNSTCMTFNAGSGYGIAVSNYFTIEGRQFLTASFILKAPLGVRIQVVLRRGASPWENVGLDTNITGTDAWQTVVLPFTTSKSAQSARLDFVVPGGNMISVDNVKLVTSLANVRGVFDSGKSINIAHHPNRGHDPLTPQSLFYAIAEDADQVSVGAGRTGSSYLTTGSDLAASAPPPIEPGTGIRIRTNKWTISDRKITSVSGSRLYFDSPTPASLSRGWGYFLYGQRWMLDEPGEWYFDAATQTVYVWMPDSAAPDWRVSVGQQAVGIQASNLSHIRIDGLAIRNVDTGVHMQEATNIVLRNLTIADTLSFGVNALLSKDSGIENSQIIRTLGDAIYASPPGLDSDRFHAYDNLIIDSSIQSKNGIVSSLPGPARVAIESGRSSVIRGNRIYGAAYIGILPSSNSVVSGNHIENTCLVLDDCGAIYTWGHNHNSIIENNTINHVVGGRLGIPANLGSHAQGIYLDELSSGITIRGNTVVDADDGIQLHNAASNRIENNTLYGNRRYPIWLQEGSNLFDTAGDVYGNVVLGNRLFPTTNDPAIRHDTYLPKTNTDRFASYAQNRYFTFFWPTLSSENWPNGAATYTLPTWQAAVSASNVSRNLDIASSEVNSANIGYAGLRSIGGNIIPNGNLNLGSAGWSYWNLTAPYGQMALEQCTTTSQCLRYTAGASESLLHSANFSVQKDQWYRISFDLKTGVTGQTVNVAPRRGGGGSNGYEEWMGAPYRWKIVGTTNLKRYSFLLKATLTINANDPVTLDMGARIDFHSIMPGENISVANLELVPVSAIEASLRSHILINPTSTSLGLHCPDGSNALLCSEYVRFTDNQSIIWPYVVAPHASEIIYSRDSNLTDGDGDGIPDNQDVCNGTQALQVVNAAGCALGQQ